MEEVIYGLLEKSLVGGAFLYLLYMFVTKFSTSQEMIVKEMVKMSKALNNVSNTLSTLDERVRKLEEEKK
jgi:hypothetical protein